MNDGPLSQNNNIPLNPNGVGSLLTKSRLELCSGLRDEPNQPGTEELRERRKRER